MIRYGLDTASIMIRYGLDTDWIKIIRMDTA